MNELNAPLRQEIAVHNCRDLIQKVPFLRRHQDDGRDDLFLGRIANALRATYFIKGDTIFEQGRVSTEVLYELDKSLTSCVLRSNDRSATKCFLFYQVTSKSL